MQLTSLMRLQSCCCAVHHGVAGKAAVVATCRQQRPSACHASIRPSQELKELVVHTDRVQGCSISSQLQCQLNNSASFGQYSHSHTSQDSLWQLNRRQMAAALPAAGSLLIMLRSLSQPPPAKASKLGAVADSAWEAMGGGPADLTFPESWLGTWDVTSTLVDVQLPLGESVVPNMAAVQRAQDEDLQRPLRYQVAFMRNPSGKVVYDRRFNTAALLATYYGSNVDFAGRISWDPQDPNILNLTMPGGLVVRTRVMRRSEQQPADDRLETSEYMQQVFDSSNVGIPHVKASQCFTKYKWRGEAAATVAEGPAIVATQVVSDYLTPYDGEQKYIAAGNKPVTTYTYKMAFERHHHAAQVASAVHVS